MGEARQRGPGVHVPQIILPPPPPPRRALAQPGPKGKRSGSPAEICLQVTCVAPHTDSDLGERRGQTGFSLPPGPILLPPKAESPDASLPSSTWSPECASRPSSPAGFSHLRPVGGACGTWQGPGGGVPIPCSLLAGGARGRWQGPGDGGVPTPCALPAGQWLGVSVPPVGDTPQLS